MDRLVRRTVNGALRLIAICERTNDAARFIYDYEFALDIVEKDFNRGRGYRWLMSVDHIPGRISLQVKSMTRLRRTLYDLHF